MSNRLPETKTQLPSLAGSLLVSTPDDSDQFEEKVCMVVHHSQQGAIGIQLNRGFRNDATDIWEHIAGFGREYREGLLHLGGPAAGPVIALHNSQQYAELETAEGVFFAAQVQNLQALLLAEPEQSKLKIVVGQAEWGPGELETEFMEGKWAVLPVTPKVVFADDQLMWVEAMKELGNRFVENAVGSRAPEDILCN